MNNKNINGLPFDITNFEEVKPLIRTTVYNKEMMKYKLPTVPHVEFLDLVECCSIVYEHGDTTVSALITHDIIPMWGVSAKDIRQIARDNFISKSNMRIIPIIDVVMEIATDADLAELEDEINTISSLREERTEGEMFVVKTSFDSRGASSILFNSLFNEFATKMGIKGFYILPSSLHEILIMTPREGINAKILRQMVLGVNGTLDKSDYMSDSVYWYSLDDNCVTIATE